MEINYREVGERIKEARIRRNITQEKLAELADMSTQHICRIENAARNVSVGAVYRIAEALEVNPDTLLSGKEEIRSIDYEQELKNLLMDCNEYEKTVLGELLVHAKKSIRRNLPLLVIKK